MEDVVVARTYKIFEVPYARRANHRRSDVRQRPCQGHLSHAYPALLGDLFNPIRVLVRSKHAASWERTDLLTISSVPTPSRYLVLYMLDLTESGNYHKGPGEH